MIGVSTLVNSYSLDTPVPRGKPYTLMVGSPGQASTPYVTARAGASGAVHVEWVGASTIADSVGNSIEFVVQGPQGSLSLVADQGVGLQSKEIGGLVAGDLYSINARVVTVAGKGLTTTVTAHAGVSALDDSVADVTVGASVNAELHTAVITWTAATDIPTPVTGYVVAREGVDATGATSLAWTTGSSVRSYQFNNLKPSSFYTFSVTPLTANGPRQSTTANVFVQPTPTVPGSDLGVTYGDSGSGYGSGEWMVSWRPPSSDGQSPITRYRLTREGRAADGKSTYQIDLPTSTRQFILSGLLGSVSYKVSVQAVNAVGAGARETLTTEQWAPVPPGAPTNVHAVAGDASARVSWTPPTNWGSSPAAGFYVDVHHGSDLVSTWGPTAADATSFTVTHLTNGQPYTFTVRAKNADVAGPASAPSEVVTPGATEPATTVPGAPIIKPASGIADGLTVRLVARWAPPVSDGGSPIVAYRVYVYGSGPNAGSHIVTVSPKLPASHTSWTTSINVVQSYRFYVRAINAVGYSDYSARSNLVVPAKVPTAPRISAASSGVPGGPITATARWSAPVSDGGATLTAYRVYAFHISPSGAVLGYTFSPRLRNNVRAYTMTLPTYGWYRFAVRAMNGMGYSAFSAKSLRVIGR